MLQFSLKSESGPVYTMDHEVGPWKMVRVFPLSNFHGRFLNKSIYKAFGPLTKCKPHVDQEECANFR